MKATAWRMRRTIALYQEGHPHTEIAERLGISMATVFRDLKGIEKRPRPQMQSQGLTERNREIAAAYVAGNTLEAVGKVYGISARAVWHHVRRSRTWPKT
jgi:DNA-binding CsgD family transcriptional regulator